MDDDTARMLRQLLDRRPVAVLPLSRPLLIAPGEHALVLERGAARLEDQVRDAVELTGRGQVARRAQQHGRVAVVAAGMHLVGNRGGVLELVLLLQMQRVHVGAQPDRLLSRPVALQGSHDAGRGQAAMYFETPGFELLCHDLGGPDLLEGGLGMTMDVASDGGQLGGLGSQHLGGEAGHGMIALSPRAVERLQSYSPAWPLPKVFRLVSKGKLAEGVFKRAGYTRLGTIGRYAMPLRHATFATRLDEQALPQVPAAARAALVRAAHTPVVAALAGRAIDAIQLGRAAPATLAGLRRVAVKEVAVRLPRLPAGLDQLRVVQLTDVHIGPTLHGPWLRQVVAQVNALEPDIVAITGLVRAEGGTYAAYGQKLEISRGELVFSGAADNPRLDVLAVRPNLDVVVGVAVAGTAQQPRIRLVSEPEMAEMDKLAQSLHEAEELRDQALAYLEQREAELTNHISQTEAELKAVADKVVAAAAKLGASLRG